MEIRINIENIDAIRQRFLLAPGITEKHINRAIKKSIFKIERESKKGEEMPVDTGRLRASIGGGGFKGGSYPKGHGRVFEDLYGEIGTDVEYAKIVHFGGGGRRARPFLARGVEIAQPEIDRFFSQALEDIGKEIMK